VSALTSYLICWALAAVAPRWAVAVLPNGTEFTLELAADPAARAQGYMGREKVGPREGMLFLFEQPARHAFWMKNCRVSLDIVWLDAALRVVDIARERPPCPEDGPCAEVVPLESASYVLEFASGTTRREGLKRGDKVVILSEPPLP
jgi:uncharacterized membrane protein (UPF0127 family)